MIYGIAIIAIQVMTLIHVVRTGRTQPWLFVVLFLPLVGSIAYLIAEVLPEVLNGKAAREAAGTAKDRLDPERHMRVLLEQAEEAQTPEAYAKLAQEYARLGRHRDAVLAYGQAAKGFFADDPGLSYAMTQAAFDGAEEGALTWSDARTAFEQLAKIDPSFKPKERSLFLARLAQAEGDTATAEREYTTLTQGYASIETRVRYAHFLFTNNRGDEARSVLESVQRESAKAAPHVRAMNQKWFDQARAAVDIVNRAGTNR